MSKQRGGGLQFEMISKGDAATDPFTPGNNEQVYIRNKYGLVKAVKRWQANELIGQHRATWATEEEWLAEDPALNGQVNIHINEKPVELVQKDDQVLEAITNTNKKLDALTDALTAFVAAQTKGGE